MIDSATEVLQQVDQLLPDILLLDVQMPGLNGIELAHRLRSLHRVCPEIIFVTAYDHFAVGAFEVEASDYLLKPVRATRLQEAIQRAVSRLRSKEQKHDQFLRGGRDFFTVEKKGRIVRIPVHAILFFKADQKYVNLHTSDENYLLEDTLHSLELEFPDLFLRIHRNALVARSVIAGMERVTYMSDADHKTERASEVWELIIDGSAERLPVSRRQWPAVRAVLYQRNHSAKN